MRIICVAILFCVAAYSQQGMRDVSLSWQHSAPTGVTYNIYRAAGSCTPRPIAWTKCNAAPITALTYLDAAVPYGRWCYYATAEAAGLESEPSNNAGADVAPRPPEFLQANPTTAEVMVRFEGVEVAAK